MSDPTPLDMEAMVDILADMRDQLAELKEKQAVSDRLLAHRITGEKSDDWSPCDDEEVEIYASIDFTDLQ